MMLDKTLQPFFTAPDNDGSGTAAVADTPVVKPPKADDDTALLDGLIGDKDLIDLDEQDKEDDDKEEKVEVIEDDKDDELIDTNARALDFAKIKEKYPDFAKTNEFREMRNSYHREAKYTELFPTIEDAQEAAENNETFVKLNDDILNHGDATSLLNAVKQASPDSLKKLSLGFLDSVAKLDNNLYIEAVSPVIKRLARQINVEGQRALKRNPDSDDGKALIATARNIMQYAFEDADAIDKDDPKPDEKVSQREKELTQREEQIRTEKFQGAYSIASNSVEKNLDKAILQGLDPDGKFNDFTRDTLVEKIKNDIKRQIDHDQLHIRRMTSLWKRAEQSGFNRESLSRIVTAYLERARPIIPTVRNKYRTIAIKGKQTDDSEDNDRGPRITTRGRSGRAPSNDGKVNIKQVDTKKIDYRHTSDTDIFDGKAKLRER